MLPSTWDLYKNGKATEGYWSSEDQTYQAYWGEPASEYWRLIFPLCKELGIEFVPVDWLEMDVWRDFDPFAIYSDPEKEKLELELREWDKKQLAVCLTGLIPFNSLILDEVTAAKYDWLQQVNPDAHTFRWVTRHLIMIQRIKNAIKKHKGKRLLCINGADHNRYLYEGLKHEKDIALIYPLKQ